MPDYVVNQYDAEGREITTGLALPRGRRIPAGMSVRADELPKGCIRSLVRRGVISPVESEED